MLKICGDSIFKPLEVIYKDFNKTDANSVSETADHYRYFPFVG